MGKSRVAPLKQMTIPRMDLRAAILAVRVDIILRKELQFQLDKSIFWTDSTTVLKYINNKTKRFQTFVANRFSFVSVTTDVSQWRYVGTKENPADEASRGLTADCFLNSKRWIKGPEFLCKPDWEWPKLHLEPAISANDPEIKQDVTMKVTVKDLLNPTNSLITYFSSWRNVKTVAAWLLKVRTTLLHLTWKRKEIETAISSFEKDPSKLKEKIDKEMQVFKATFRGQCLCPEDLLQAKSTVISFSQRQRFEEKLSVLEAGKNWVKRSSHLYKLDRVLNNALLRVGGRLNRLVMPEEAKHSNILPKDLHITLLLWHIHEQLGHGGRNHMLSRHRKGYWIICCKKGYNRL